MRLDTPLCETLRPDEKAAAAAGLVPLLPPSRPHVAHSMRAWTGGKAAGKEGSREGRAQTKAPTPPTSHPGPLPSVRLQPAPQGPVLCPWAAPKASPEGRMGQDLGAPWVSRLGRQGAHSEARDQGSGLCALGLCSCSIVSSQPRSHSPPVSLGIGSSFPLIFVRSSV